MSFPVVTQGQGVCPRYGVGVGDDEVPAITGVFPTLDEEKSRNEVHDIS
jgi:hypothetical protein